MNVIQQKKFDNEDLDLFDESDWNFLDVSESSKNFQFFDDVYDKDFVVDDFNKSKLVIFTLLSAIIGVLVAFIIIACYQAYIVPKLGLSSNEEYNQVVQGISNTALEHIDGKIVDSNTLIEISDIFNTYFSTLSSQSNYDKLNTLCLTGSNFASVETKYRKSAKSSYDSDDCYARALREFSSFISLDYVNEIIYKDGMYYCYVVLNIPSSNEFFEYFISHRYEMNKYFTYTDLDSINITKYMLTETKNDSIPTISKEFLFKVSCVDNNYVINDDSQITNVCTDAYNSAISNIVQILGGVLVRTQYE